MHYSFELGPWSRTITTQSDDAQRWFDRGLNWTYAYNHEEAVACYRRALDADPTCAMAWWGVAYASGPFYNRPWIRYTDREIANVLPVCFEAAGAAASYAEQATDVERALIGALTKRYQSGGDVSRDVLQTWIWQYADAMRDVHQAFLDDPDVGALYAEAAVTCTPRQLWNLQTGAINPQSRTSEVLPVLQRWVDKITRGGRVHPGLLHMYIHALEMSPIPHRALVAADLLRGFALDAGHLEHMPAHIYVLCGDYAGAVSQSERAVAADDKYLEFAGDRNFYTTARCHDLHLLMFAAMFLGAYRKASTAAQRIEKMASPDLIAGSEPFMASILDGYAAMHAHVRIRFGRWHEIVQLSPPQARELRPIGTAMHAYAQGVAQAALGNIDEAHEARSAFDAACSDITEDAIFLSNPVREHASGRQLPCSMANCEYRMRNYDQAFSGLRLAVARDDALNYTEPWAWMHPPRHALGALLAEQGEFEEAEAGLPRPTSDSTAPGSALLPASGQYLGLARVVGVPGTVGPSAGAGSRAAEAGAGPRARRCRDR